MALEKQIMEEMKAAMKSKDKTALEALRAIKSAILLAKTDGSGSELSEADEIAILQKQIKMRKDAASQFAEQGRNEMAENELAQASVIEKFLPEQLSTEDLLAEIAKIVEETGATEMKDMGKVMKLANERLAGKADSKAIADAVKSKLAK
ncbi:GatB/YqeY domain-containing protein [Ornithobacterium rhinotracheale]|uniref:GatB/YqeY domain-containing protein n=1 Tax=Ornithobacterium rhinotracheale TaxID=28251 RepID=UPI00129C7C95|nr:GatB/YqeY domain-containing protein [Ornithobacterium rhinotracheale]MRJ08822.1 GatB/YqeY domain-containing protein [Ornithobacterium rhinotracheale]UOH77705.1 GatB/YqeY domain-containing protein [Ornithobacterium rhinotracheale]